MKLVAVAILVLSTYVEVEGAGAPAPPSGADTDSFLTSEWLDTLDVAEGQAMLTQKMTKQFLLVAKNIEAADNKYQMSKSIKKFDEAVTNLKDGNSALHIKAAPTDLVKAKLDEVKGMWTTFKALLEDNVDTVRDASGYVDYAVVTEVSLQNLPLLEASNDVVSYLEDAAKATGAKVKPLAVKIATRQDVYIFKMATEAFLIGLGADVAHNIYELAKTVKLFDDSHRGIIEGAEWAGVPTLRKFCTMYEVRDVTYEWSKFKPLVDSILAQKTEEEMTHEAYEESSELAELSLTLYYAMQEAVDYFRNDTGSCDHLYEITYSEWVYLIDNSGTQRYLGQKVSQLFMQIANGIDVSQSKVDLTVAMTDTYNHLRSLIEGSKVNKIPSVPTQHIADELLLVYKSWVSMQTLIQQALNSGDYKNSLTVSQVAEMSRTILKEMDVAAELYEERAKYAYSAVPGHLINIAGSQRKLFQKMSKEASLIRYGEDPETNWDNFNYTRKMFNDRHWELVHGAPATYKYPALPKTDKICLIQTMRTVDDRFVALETAALKVALGGEDEIRTLISVNPEAYQAMDDAVTMYTAFAAPTDPSDYKSSTEVAYVEEKRQTAEAMCTAIMDDLEISVQEWKAVIVEIGHLRALTQEAASNFLLASSGKTTDKNNLEGSITSLQDSLTKLTYGSGRHHIPASPSQDVLDDWFSMEGEWSSFKHKLEQGRRLQAGLNVSTDSVDMLGLVENLMGEYTEAAKTDKGEEVPADRLNIASRQSMLAYKMAKEALLLMHGVGSSLDLDDTIADFERAHDQLRNGGGGVKAIIPERPDLRQQWDSIDGRWKALKPAIQTVAATTSTDSSAVGELQASLNALTQELDVSLVSFGELDPYVPPKDPPFPWTTAIFAIMGVLLVFVICIGCMAAGVCKSKSSSNSGGSQWNSEFNGSPSKDSGGSPSKATKTSEQEGFGVEAV